MTDGSFLAVTVLLRGNGADAEVLARGIEIAESNRARLQLALLASPAKTAYLRAALISAGSDLDVLDWEQHEVLRRALDSVPAAMPVTTRILCCGPIAAVRRILADSDHCLLVPESPRFSYLARKPLHRRWIRTGRLTVVGARQPRSIST